MSFQVVVQATDRAFVGIGPFDPGTDFGPDYPIHTIDDDAQQDVLMRLDTPYLCSDLQHFEGAPC